MKAIPKEETWGRRLELQRPVIQQSEWSRSGSKDFSGVDTIGKREETAVMSEED